MSRRRPVGHGGARPVAAPLALSSSNAPPSPVGAERRRRPAARGAPGSRRGALGLAVLAALGCSLDSTRVDSRLYACAGPADCGDGFGCLAGVCRPAGYDGGSPADGGPADAGADAGAADAGGGGGDGGCDAALCLVERAVFLDPAAGFEFGTVIASSSDDAIAAGSELISNGTATAFVDAGRWDFTGPLLGTVYAARGTPEDFWIVEATRVAHWVNGRVVAATAACQGADSAYDLAIARPGLVWLATSTGACALEEDGGALSATHFPVGAVPMRSVALDGLDVLLGGEDGRVHQLDGGVQPAVDGGWGMLSSLAGSADAGWYAAATLGQVLRRDATGVWAPVLDLGSGSAFTQVTVLAADDVWAAGSSTLRHLGASGWSELRLPGDPGTDHVASFAVGGGFLVVGGTWYQLSSNTRHGMVARYRRHGPLP